MNVPKLRFKGFSGEWDSSKKLQSYIVSLQSGKSKVRLDQGRFPFYGSTGVIGFTDSPDYEGKTLLIARVGANAGGLFSVKGNYSVSDNTLMVKVSEKNDFNFFKYLLEGFNINRLVFGSGQPLVTGGQLKELLIVVPVLPEQTKIASFLTAIDEKIDQLTQKHELLSQYKKGVMQQIFSQQLRFKDDNGEEFGEWEEKKLGDLIIKHDEKTDKHSQYPVLTSSRNGIFFQKDYFSGKDIASSDTTGYNVVPYGYFTYRHMSDDLIFKFNINTLCEKGIVSTLYPVFTVDNRYLDNYFLQVILNEGKEFKNFAMMQKQGGSRTYMYFSKLSELFLTLPCLREQTKIANFLSSIDQKIDQAAAQLDAVKQYKRGLLQQMFV